MTTPQPTMTVLERAARAVADENGDDFDHVHRDKSHWTQTHGKIEGVFRDLNALRQDDYLLCARAVISSLREPTQEMVDAPEERFRAITGPAIRTAIFQAMIDKALEQ